ncbi:MAG: bifunctional riboflavin kinase/FAD synthetase [Bacteroidetes bacterium]|nr:bifunctional riboflavin kinase/FAD synthetase [Bacteroidota bacterium]
MKIIYDLKNISNNNYAVATIGTFDGIHLGHQKLLNTVVEYSKKNNFESVVLTFDPHPRDILRPNEPRQTIITTLNEKLELFEFYGIDKVYIIPFTAELSKLNYEEFLQKYLIELCKVKYLVIGYDHSFGKSREGKFDTLTKAGIKFGFTVEQVNQVYFKNFVVKSSLIRDSLRDGNIDLVNNLLGRNYQISGEIIHGDKRGKELGFPTANIKINDSQKLIPKNGIYFVKVKLNNKTHFGLLSVGTLPTFYNEHNVVVEVYLFNFSQDIYNEELTIYLVKFIREQKKFNSISELITAMKEDKQLGLKIIENEYSQKKLI